MAVFIFVCVTCTARAHVYAIFLSLRCRVILFFVIVQSDLCIAFQCYSLEWSNILGYLNGMASNNIEDSIFY